jgi:SAM-dependent methyltransferase
MIESILRKARRTILEARSAHGEHGASAALALILRKVGQAGRRLVVFAAEIIVDRRYGMTTRGIVRNEHTLRAKTRDGSANYYQAISLKGFRRVVDAAHVDPSTTTFVDLGAGRGRAVILAAHHGFRNVLGVELDPVLTEQARANLARWEARRGRSGLPPVRVEIHTGDAVHVELPRTPVLLFLYNSFGPAPLRILLERVIAAHEAGPRPMTLCYFNPVHADVVEEHPQLTVTARGDGWLVYSIG